MPAISKDIVRLGTLVGLGVAFAAAVLAGTSTRADGATAPPVKGTISLLVSNTQQKGFDLVIANFKRVYPDADVKPQYVSGGSVGHAAALLPQLQAGSGPDVMIAYPGKGVSPSVVELQQAGYIESLAGRPWVKRDPKFVRDLTNVNGKPYMLETGVQMAGVLYNVDKFNALGLRPPTTFAQLLQLCRTIREKSPGTIPIAFAGAQAPLTGPVATAFAVSDVYSADPGWNAKRSEGKTTFFASKWRQSLQKIVSMKEAGCFSESVAGDQFAAQISQAASGRALMSIANTSFFGNTIVAAPAGTRFSLFAVPGNTAAQTRMVVFPSQGVALNAKSKNKVAGRAFIDFLARPKQNDVFVRADGYGNIAPYNFTKGDWPPFYRPLLPYLNKTITTPFYFWPTPGTFAVLGRSVQGLLTEQKTIDQVLRDLDESWGK